MPFLLQLGDGLQAACHPGFKHYGGMQRNVRASGGMRGRGEVVGVGFTGHFEHRHRNCFG